MQLIATFDKHPDDQLDYDVDFSRWMPDGDLLTSAEAITQSGTVEVLSVQIIDSLIVKIWLAGGKTGESSVIAVRAGSQGGRVKDVEFGLRIRGQEYGCSVYK
ncbi:hypothetical protein BKM35_22165 [Salmonella enterica]|nr:hypothetical protein [Salmonella enterica]